MISRNEPSLTTNFGKSADAYDQFRPKYPGKIFERILVDLGPPHDLAIDLGSGTGDSAEPLLAHFKEVIAVEPDAAMRAKLSQNCPDARIEACKAENFRASPGTVDLVSAGNVLYWTEAKQVSMRVADALRLGGIFAVYRYDFPTSTDPAVAKLLDECLVDWDPHRRKEMVHGGEVSLQAIRDSNQFADITVETFNESFNLPPDSLLGYFRSTSYVTSLLQKIENPAAYLEQLKSKLEEVSQAGLVKITFPFELIIAKH